MNLDEIDASRRVIAMCHGRAAVRTQPTMSSCLHGDMRAPWIAGMKASASNGEAEMVSLTVRVPAELRKRLRVHAAEYGMSVQDCAQSALVMWLDQRESGDAGEADS